MTDQPPTPPPGNGGPPPVDPPPPGGAGPTGPGGPAPAVRALRRSSTDHVVGGVAGGLGRYFEVDPVLFRVLFAVTGFFGGVGLAAYAVAWAVIPEEGATDPPVDRLIAELRRRNIPFWPAVVLGGIVLWGLLHAWSPWGIGPVVVAAVIIGLALRKRQPRPVVGYPADGPRPAGPLPGDATLAEGPPAAATVPAGLGWVDNARAWKAESSRARRERRRRTAPVRWISFAVMVATLGVIGLVDAADGVPIAAYGWAMLIVSLDALIIGGLLRRTPWLTAAWIPLAIVILVAFGGSRASLHDGSGSRLVAPQTMGALQADHRMAFGQTRLDLTAIGAGTGDARTVHVRQAVGRVVLDLPRAMAVTVHSKVRFGEVSLDGEVDDSAVGINVSRDYVQQGTGGGRLTIDVDLAAGELAINHVG